LWGNAREFLQSSLKKANSSVSISLSTPSGGISDDKLCSLPQSLTAPSLAARSMRKHKQGAMREPTSRPGSSNLSTAV
jgi:hypothetical protein